MKEWKERALSCAWEWKWPVLSFQLDICWYGVYCLYIQFQRHGPWQRLLSVGIREETKWERFSCNPIPPKREVAKRPLKLEHPNLSHAKLKETLQEASAHVSNKWVNTGTHSDVYWLNMLKISPSWTQAFFVFIREVYALNIIIINFIFLLEFY